MQEFYFWRIFMDGKQLVKYLDRLAELNIIKSDRERSEIVSTIRDRLLDDTFRIAVVGEFSSGKSTFINALIGKNLLTHAVNETTAAITCLCNIPVGDSRNGSCELEFRNGKHSIISIDELWRYTTTQSNEDVSGTVRRVKVCIHFFDAKYPIEIIDTPGLNGVADKLRDITIEEVKKAHACVYLLSIKGITASDTDFIRILQCYQSNFIFVQNFIDQLKAHEGETIEKKLENDKELIDAAVGGGEYFDYKICGISALKKLCAEDTNIKRLYSDDTEEITDVRRLQLKEESGFQDFDYLLSELTAKKKYKETVITSAVQAIEALTDGILPLMQQQKDFNAELRKNDDRTKRVEKLQRLIDDLNNKRERNRKKLANFIVSRDAENRSLTKKYTAECIDKVYSNVCNEIEQILKTFDDLDMFRDEHDGKYPYMFFGNRAENMVNSIVIPDIDERIASNFSHLYDEAVQRVTDYAMNFSGKTDEIDINVRMEQREFNFSDQSYEAQIEWMKKDKKIVQDKKTEAEQSKAEAEKSFEDISRELQIEYEEKVADDAQTERERRNFGKRPAVEKIEVTKYKKVDRGGIGFLDWLLGPKEISYTDYEYDDSAQKKWDKAYNEYINRREQLRQRHEREIQRMSEQKNKYEIQRKRNTLAVQRLESDIKSLESRIQSAIERYEQMKKYNQAEFFRNEKAKLMAAVEDALRGRNDKECVLERIEYHIDKVSEKYIKNIKERIDRYYINRVNARVEELQKLINRSTEELEQQYKVEEKEIFVINTIKKEMKKNFLANKIKEKY